MAPFVLANFASSSKKVDYTLDNNGSSFSKSDKNFNYLLKVLISNKPHSKDKDSKEIVLKQSDSHKKNSVNLNELQKSDTTKNSSNHKELDLILQHSKHSLHINLQELKKSSLALKSSKNAGSLDTDYSKNDTFANHRFISFAPKNQPNKILTLKEESVSLPVDSVNLNELQKSDTTKNSSNHKELDLILQHSKHSLHINLQELEKSSLALKSSKNAGSLKDIIQTAEDLNLNLDKIEIYIKPNIQNKSYSINTNTLSNGTVSLVAANILNIKETKLNSLDLKHNQETISNTKSGKQKISLANLLVDEKIDSGMNHQDIKDTKPPFAKSNDIGYLNSFLKKDFLNKGKAVEHTLQTDMPTQTVESLIAKDNSQLTADISSEPNQYSIKNDTEAFTRKIIEAKNTIKHFTNSLQEHIENYKPPFTRVKLTLDPKELGSVDVTLVNRGNNLHIQVNSNPTAIALMATHGNELKSQLVSMGFTDIQMQFSMNQQQQNGRNRQNIENTDNFEKMEDETKFYDSLELIVARYV